MFLELPGDTRVTDQLKARVAELEQRIMDLTTGAVVTPMHSFWETVESYDGYTTERGKIPGGWMFRIMHRYRDERDKTPPPTPVFIADPLHHWVVTND